MKKKSKFVNFLSYSAILLSAFAVGFCAALSIDIVGADEGAGSLFAYLFSMFLPFAFSIISAAVMLFFHIAIHELGHLIFGKFSGYRFISYRFMSFLLLRNDGKIKLKRMKISGTSGQCIMAPPKPNDENMPTILYNIGGGIANFATSVLFVMLGIIFRSNSWFLVFSIMSASVGGYMTIANLLPMRIGGVANDGYNLTALSKNPAAKRALSIQLSASAMAALGVRLYDMPDEWFYESEISELENIHIAAHAYLSAQRILDSGDIPGAYEKMRELSSSADLLPIYAGLMRCDMAFCEAVAGADSLKIQGLLDKNANAIRKSMNGFPSVIRTEYALALLRGDNKKAEAYLAKFEKTSKTYPNAVEIDSERELIEYAKEKLKQKQ